LLILLENVVHVEKIVKKITKYYEDICSWNTYLCQFHKIKTLNWKRIKLL